MDTIVTFASENGHYTSVPCLVWCLDSRFRALRNEHLRTTYEIHVFDASHHFDQIMVAGGAKHLTAHADPQVRDFMLFNIAAAMQLHAAHSVDLMVHQGCGAYGKEFTTEAEEHLFYKTELLSAGNSVRGMLKERFPDREISVRLLYADFSGLHQIVEGGAVIMAA